MSVVSKTQRPLHPSTVMSTGTLLTVTEFEMNRVAHLFPRRERGEAWAELVGWAAGRMGTQEK